MLIDADLGGDVNEDEGEEGTVGTRDGGCWRIRRRPDAPRPCSCSGTIGDLAIGSNSVDAPASKEKRILPFSLVLDISASRFPVLRFFGRKRLSEVGSICCLPELNLAVSRH